MMFHSTRGQLCCSRRHRNRIRRLTPGVRVVWMLGLLLSTSATGQEVVLRIQPESHACVTVLTNQPGGLYQGCPLQTHLRQIQSVPQEYPLDLVVNQEGWWLLTRYGVYHRPGTDSSWRQITNAGGMALGCAKKECRLLSWRGIPRTVSSSGPAEPSIAEGLPDAPAQHLVFAGTLGWLAGVYGRGVFHLPPDASAWQAFHEGLRSRNVLSLACDPARGCLAGTWGDGLYRLKASDGRWQQVAHLDAKRVSALAIDAHVWLAVTDVGVMRSADAGQHWNALSLPTKAVISAVALSDGGRYWLGDTEGALYSGLDASAPVLVHTPDMYRVQALSTAADGAAYVLMGNALLGSRSRDLDVWQRIELPIYSGERMSGMNLDRRGRLMLATPRAGVFCLPQRAGKWSDCGSGLPKDARVHQMHRATDGTLYLTSSGGKAEQQLFQWQADDARWQPVRLSGKLEPAPYGLRWLTELPGGVLVAWGTYSLKWKWPEEGSWRQAWFSRLKGEPPSVDAEGRVWIESSEGFSFRVRGETHWHKAQPPAQRWHEAISVAENRWLSRAATDAHLTLLAAQRDGVLHPLSHWDTPAVGPLMLSRNGGARLLLGSGDGLYLLDLDAGVWQDVTPGPERVRAMENPISRGSDANHVLESRS